MSELTIGQIAVALAPVSVALPNTPKLDTPEYLVWQTLLAPDKVTANELCEAVLDVLRREKFFPPPAIILDAVKALRIRRGKAREQAVLDDRMREAEQRRALPPAETQHRVEGEWAPIEELEVPPPRIRQTAKECQFGPVKLPDGRLDPRWPEIPGREPAWFRRAKYGQGLYHPDDKRAYQAATAPTKEQARALSRGQRTGIPGVERAL